MIEIKIQSFYLPDSFVNKSLGPKNNREKSDEVLYEGGVCTLERRAVMDDARFIKTNFAFITIHSAPMTKLCFRNPCYTIHDY